MPRINTYTITKVEFFVAEVSGMAFVGCNSQLCFFLMCAMCVLTGPYKQCIQHSQRTNVIVVCFSSLQKSEVMYRKHTVSRNLLMFQDMYLFVFSLLKQEMELNKSYLTVPNIHAHLQQEILKIMFSFFSSRSQKLDSK